MELRRFGLAPREGWAFVEMLEQRRLLSAVIAPLETWTSPAPAVVRPVQAPSSVAASESALISAPGQQVQVSAQVSTTFGGVPTGSVTLYRDQNVLSGPVVLGAAITSQTLDKYGRAVLKTIPTIPYDLGTENYVVKYSGDLARRSSLSAPFAHTVLDGTKITGVSSSPYPCVSGQDVAFTIKIAGDLANSPVPLGSVQLSIGNKSFVRSANGLAIHVSLPAGTYPFQITYSGDAKHSGSSAIGTHTVQKDGTATLIQSATHAVVVGHDAHLQINEVPNHHGSIKPTGAITARIGNGPTQGPFALSSTGAATFSIHGFAAGNNTVHLGYVGDTSFNGNSLTVTVVGQLPTTTTVTAQPNPVALGSAVTLKAHVKTADSMPTGVVEFRFGPARTLLGVASVNAVGDATIFTSALPLGNSIIYVTYSGDTNHASSDGGISVTLMKGTKRTVGLLLLA